MEWWLLLTLFISALVLLVLLRVPVAYAILGISLVFAMWVFGVESAASQFILGSISSVSSFTLVPVPLFILLGALLTEAGLASKALQVLDQMFGKIRARLPMLAIASGGLLGVLSGSAMASTAILGKSLLPDMVKEDKYSRTLSVGSILGSGGLAMVLPPSAMAVVLGAIASISIGHLLIAGVVPGLLMLMSYFVIVYVWARFFKGAKPAQVEPGVRGTVGERFRDVMVYLAPLSIIVFLVLGLIVLGVATPTESAALGVVGALVLGLIYQRGAFAFIGRALFDTAKISAAILVILMASSLYSQLLSFSGASRGLVGWMTGLDVAPYVVLLFMMLTVLLLGLFLEQISIMLVTLPLYMPVVTTLGWDPVWFGVLVLINIQIAGTSPPFGLNLFVMKSVAPEGIGMGHIYRGAVPFIVSDLLVMLAIVLLPSIALWLPMTMMN